jgi:hypothetical protein
MFFNMIWESCKLKSHWFKSYYLILFDKKYVNFIIFDKNNVRE